MYDLYIDTHSSYLSLALLKNKRIIDKNKINSVNEHSKLTLYKISLLLDKYKITIDDLENIIVVNGPGSFTGTRVGVTIAKTIGFLKHINVIPIDYLYLQALSINDKLDIITSVEDKKGYFLGKFDKNRKKIEEYTYVRKENINENFYPELDEIKLEENYDMIIKEKVNNIHEVSPLYVKKIDV